MNFIEKVDILNYQLVGDEDEVDLAYLEILNKEAGNKEVKCTGFQRGEDRR